MRKIPILIVIVCIVFVPLSLFATDLKWRSPVMVDPPNPQAGNMVTLRCKLKSGGGPSSNVLVHVRIDGKQVWQTTYPQLAANQFEMVQHTLPATAGHHNVEFVIDPFNTTNDANPANNVRVGQFTATGSNTQPGLPIITVTRFEPIKQAFVAEGAHLPNIIVSHFEWSPKNFTSGKIVTFRYQLKNIGLTDAKPMPSVAVQMNYLPANVNGPFAPNSVLRPRQVSPMYEWKWKAECGTTVKVVADNFNQIKEVNEGDNSKTVNLAPHCTKGKPNLVIEELQFYEIKDGGSWTYFESPGHTRWAMFFVKVKNVGAENAGPSRVAFGICYTHKSGKNVPLLVPGESWTFSMVGKASCHCYARAGADKGNLVKESNEGDNWKEVWMQCEGNIGKKTFN
jgi:hypothetical protein